VNATRQSPNIDIHPDEITSDMVQRHKAINKRVILDKSRKKCTICIRQQQWQNKFNIDTKTGHFIDII